MDVMKYYSTNGAAPAATFRDALLKGLAPDKGLYMPERIPRVSPEELARFSDMEYHEIAFDICRKYLHGVIPEDTLAALTKDAYSYPVPLEQVYERKYVMRLDQGPTASFKDFAARMMGRWMQFYLQEDSRSLLILVATSGDTGSAIANAFYGLDNISVCVLFPTSEVTPRQRKQMTTLGGNVRIVGIDGKFDHCQALVKEAFADPALGHILMSSANSINIGRLVPQIVYYFYAYSRLRKEAGERAVFSVPSGNFGDMMGGVLALHMGLPVKRFIIATNENDEFPSYLATGTYDKIEPSRNCISSAMNVGHPSNLARLVDLYGGVMNETGVVSRQCDLARMRRDLFSVSVTDAETRQTIRRTHEAHGTLLEPHGAVGWTGLERYLATDGADDGPEQLCVSLETAHPAKFPEEIRGILNLDPPLPPSLAGLEEKEEFFTPVDNNYPAFKSFLLETYA